MDAKDEMSIERMLEIVTQLSVVNEDERERLRKLLIERTGSANIPSVAASTSVPFTGPDGGTFNSADSKQRLTYDPTDYEYYLFFVTMAFVIGVVGKLHQVDGYISL